MKTAFILNHRPISAAALITVAALSVAVTGCSTFKRSVADNSLDYAKTQKLAPVQLPAAAQTLPFTPIYHVTQSGENTLKLKNDSSKRFELPRPISTVKQN